ncbi:MAG TPA: electron transfer flavoprotein subunit beta/FixA family protein [Legionellaceae bacterium]|nr:electron transfer flavoprotein subunit beta/FixA family protein [Legionellaceae bacterium]
MKILVTVKRVIDPYVRIRLKADHSDVDMQNIKMSMNPFDEIALEEALRLREKQWAKEVILVTIGTQASQETLRHGLALGADRAILVHTDNTYCSLNRAKILQKIVLAEAPDLVLMGKQAIDDDNNQTPQMLAGLLNWPQITFASKLEIMEKEIAVTREIDQGHEILQTALPAVVSVDLRLNEPRYATLPNIMKAKQKPLQIIELSNLNLALKDHVRRVQLKPPPLRPGGIKVDSITALLDKLQHEAKVLL